MLLSDHSTWVADPYETFPTRKEGIPGTNHPVGVTRNPLIAECLPPPRFDPGQ